MSLQHPSRRRVLGVLGLVAVLAPFAVADDKKEGKKAVPVGSWAKKEGQMLIEFADKGVVKLHPHGDKADLAIVCSFTTGKDGVVKVKVTDHEGKEEFKAKVKQVVPTGTEFQFKWTATDDTATVENLDGKDADGLKSHLEGGYEKKR
jgi:hypothetical protein